MTREIEDLIRTAQERQADRALPADRIRAALPRRAAQARRRRRYGMAGAAVAAVSVAAAVTVPVVLLRGPGPAGTAPTAAGAATAPSGAEPTVAALPQTYPLGYRPAWAPPGFGERIRFADSSQPGDPFGPTVQRVWKKQVGPGDPWNGAGITLYVRTEVPDPAQAMDTSGQRVDINGVRGYYSAGGDAKSYVDWSPNGHTVLMLAAGHFDISKADLLRMARSVRPDPTVATIPVNLRWLPEGWTTTAATISGQGPTTWRAEVSAVRREVPTGAATPGKDKRGVPPVEGGTVETGSLSVVVGAVTDAPAGGKQLTVGGHPARQPVRTDAPGRDLIYLVVDLGQGRLMTLVGEGAGLTVDDLVKVAEQAEVNPPGKGWIGN
ncbi:hypothetical protein [Actinoplanes regularis]|uniref:DUF4367 domain-containing protein n=1 Tax=Actinoplanes regularis TaxID=52697 RepID=A0A239DX12_9ACTN|nr:hypothetical protein [Actinoplanes regularis]GIE88956.1 hypothetical protein Are01nite_54360 [Actinoplanes regularis]SNS37075.1 hypothetical protein SAMN06264365_114147 [Actinoplanes regularis]